MIPGIILPQPLWTGGVGRGTEDSGEQRVNTASPLLLTCSSQLSGGDTAFQQVARSRRTSQGKPTNRRRTSPHTSHEIESAGPRLQHKAQTVKVQKK